MCLYNYGTEYFKQYFNHIERLIPGLKKQIDNKSGICHHMIFEKKYVYEIMNICGGINSFYGVFLNNVEEKYYDNSGASEYELYFNYMLYKHREKIRIRKLKCKLDLKENDLKNFDKIKYDYVSIHWYRKIDINNLF